MIPVAIDLETRPFAPGLMAPPVICVSVARPNTPSSLYLARHGIEVVRGLLRDPTKALVFHNGAYDLSCLCAADPSLYEDVYRALDADRIHDTKIREELNDIASGRTKEGMVFRDGAWIKPDYSLAGNKAVKGSRGLVWRHLSKDRSADKTDPEAWRMRYQELEDLPLSIWPEKAKRYALEDAEDTLAVFQKQFSPADEHAQVRAAFALKLMSDVGLHTDGHSVRALKKRMTGLRKKNRKWLIRAGLLKPKYLTKKQVVENEPYDERDATNNRLFVWSKDLTKIRELVRKRCGRRGTPLPVTGGGGISTDRDSLLQSGSRLAAILAGASGVDKILDTYMPVLEAGVDLPIHTRFNVLVNSGRSSSANPNLQNLPSGRKVGGVRECFVPSSPDYVLASIDYDILELRALAQVCLWLFGRSRLAEVLKSGRDVHVDMACQILGITYEEGWARHKAKDASFKSARDLAKICNFGYPGGLGANAFVDYARQSGQVITLGQSYDLKATFFRNWPEMTPYFDFVNSRVGRGFGSKGTIEQFLSKRVRGHVGFCDTANTLFQGLAADGAKRAVYRVSRAAQTSALEPSFNLTGSKPIAFIHDEILSELPRVWASSLALRMAALMCESMKEFIPDIPITASPVLMSVWSKQAHEVYDAAGNLDVWTPQHDCNSCEKWRLTLA